MPSISLLAGILIRSGLLYDWGKYVAVDTLHGAIRKEASMACHRVTIMNIPRMLAGANDIVFEIKENEIKIGDLKVSQGNLF